MIYFTVWHWIVTVLFIALLVYLTVKSLLGGSRSMILSMLFASVLSVIAGYSAALVVLEKQTKQCELVDVETKRVLMNETVVFKGHVKNTGDYTIGHCRLHIRMVNEVFKTSMVGKDAFFQNKPGIQLGIKESSRKQEKPQSQERTLTVARMLEPGSTQSFAVAMPYPPYFRATRYFYDLSCH